MILLMFLCKFEVHVGECGMYLRVIFLGSMRNYYLMTIQGAYL